MMAMFGRLLHCTLGKQEGGCLGHTPVSKKPTITVVIPSRPPLVPEHRRRSPKAPLPFAGEVLV
jgi:hypothetical protein